MTSVSESISGKHQLGSTLNDGVNTLSENQTVSFTKYIRFIHPIDGSVFWVKQGDSLTAQGSFHYSTNQNQKEDESASVNFVVFTSLHEINFLNDVGPDSIYIGVFEGTQFAFNKRSSYYKQSGLYHYSGDALYPMLQGQVVDSIGDVLDNLPVISNSLPIWLYLNQCVAVYPSYLVPANAAPPYVAVHIIPNETMALQPAANSSAVYQTTNGIINKPLDILSAQRFQLTRDKVRLTLWGLRNDQAQGYLDYLLGYMTNHDDLGLMNMPIIRDEKKTQTELNILGQKKTIELEVSYYQSTACNCAKKLITSVLETFLPGV